MSDLVMSEEDSTRVPPAKSVRLAGSIESIVSAVTPVTVVTALLVHVGSVRSRAYYGYFGLDQSLLQLSVQDYALGSVDVTFGAIIRLVAAGLIFILLDRVFVLFRSRVRAENTTAVNLALVIVGAVWLGASLISALGVANGMGIPPLATAALLAVGAGLVLRFGPGLIPSSISLGRSATVALYTVLVLALFWAATLYAQDLGQRAAKAVDANPAGLPLVTIFSKDYLDLPGSQTQPTQTLGADNSARYRYSGFSLLNYSNGTWVLISGRYSNDYRPSVLILRDSPTINVEIAVSRSR